MNPSDGALIFGGLAVLFLAIAGMLGIEAYLLLEQRAPITTYTRMAIVRWPGVMLTSAGVFLLAIGALLGHLVWDVNCG